MAHNPRLGVVWGSEEKNRGSGVSALAIYSKIRRRGFTAVPRGSSLTYVMGISRIAAFSSTIGLGAAPMQSTHVRVVIMVCVLLGCAVAGFGWLVWPTAYQYDHINLRGTVMPVRIHRLTGTTEVLYASGWRELSGPQSENPLPAAELAKLNINGNFSFGTAYLSCYNGSTWSVSEITATVGVRDAAGKVILERDYRFGCDSGACQPLKSASFNAYIMRNLNTTAGETWFFSVKSAKGSPSR